MATAAGVNADREDTDAWGRTPSVPLSRGLKIEDLASEIAADGQSDVSQLFSREALSHAVSGSIGGNIAMLAFYPLDQLVMRAQAATDKGKSGGPLRAMMDVVSTEGVSGLYRGLNSTLFTLFFANFIYFYAFHLMRAFVGRNKRIRKLGKSLNISRAMSNLLLGTLAGAINVCFVQPLWVANARLKLEGGKYKGIVDVLMRIVNEEGYQKLWAGVSSSLLLCCNPAIQFAVYETVKKILIARKARDSKHKALTSLEAFVLGALAKWIATVATYPLQVAQTRLRFGKSHSRHEYKGTFDCLRDIYKTEGRSGLYRGMETKLWHSTLISALMFLSYEKIQLAVARVVTGEAAKPTAAAPSPASTPSSSPALAPSPPPPRSSHLPPLGPREDSPPPDFANERGHSRDIRPLTSTSSFNSLSDLQGSSGPSAPPPKLKYH